jgi:dolichol-phosphate mannosyltransferase
MIDLTIVVPTLNERDNIQPMVAELERVLVGVAWEVVFVDDDSADGTVARIQELAQSNPRIRCLHRIGRRGLSSACIEGALSSTAPVIAVTDADMQHDETLLPQMLLTLKNGSYDIVIGSRYMAGGNADSFDSWRAKVSEVATRLGKRLIKADVTDPMSGFFMIRRDAFDRAVRSLSGIGFKILLDIFTSYPGRLRFAELPYQFRERLHGDSKLDTMVIWEYLMLIIDKRSGGLVPARFLMFCLVGGLGLGVNLAVLDTAIQYLPVNFRTAVAIATFTAMVFNFWLNNVFTYRDRRLKGWRFVQGLISFCLVCSIGGIANVGAADFLFGQGKEWWAAGIAGALVSVIWNYATTSIFTWRNAMKRSRRWIKLP